MAANNDHMKAQNMVACDLETGSGGIRRNKKDAIQWYEKIARQGNMQAAYKLAEKTW